MIDREKVIKGLECCTTMDDRGFPTCEQCPYNDEEGTCSKLDVFLRDALELLKAKDTNVPATWISVKDRPPKFGQRVLILSRYGHVSDAELNQYDDGLYFDPFGYELSDGYVTHWMPLPELPKEDGNEV